MKIGATLAFNHHTSPAFIAEAGQLVEDAGFHALWVPEHVLFFPEYDSTYPYSSSGRIPGEPVGILDPFTALTFVAANTRRIRLATGICLVPQRQPVYTARLAADLDYLSGGRFDFGVGIGWLAEEFQALDMPFATRAKRCAEYIDAMRALWTQAEPSFDGETVHIPRCHFNPKPVQAGGPPIYFGGESQAALARVATRGDGWYGFNLDPAAVRERLVALEALLAAAGRQRSDIQVAIGPNSKPVTPDTVAGYREAGVDQLVVGLMAGNVDSLRRRIDSMRATVGM
ncbi:MAG: LLM class F420-dependent oxidoreductase [Pseudomonadales bacterium]